MVSARSLVTVCIGRMEFNCHVDWRYNPGEPEVRYYADGSGYPGSPDEFDCIDSVKVLEVEYRFGSSDICEDGWGYKDRDGLGDCADLADRWCLEALEGRDDQSDLFNNVEGEGW